MKWRKWLIAVLFILVGAWLFCLNVEIKNNSAFLEELKAHNHDDRYFICSDVEKRLRYVRDDIRAYIDHENDMIKAATDLLKRLDIDELENDGR